MVEEHQTVVGTCLLLMGSTPACRYSPPDGPSVVMSEHKSCPAPAPISKLSSALRRPVIVNVANTAGSSGKLDVWWQIVLQLIRQVTVMLKKLTGFGWNIPKKTQTKRLPCTSHCSFPSYPSKSYWYQYSNFVDVWRVSFIQFECVHTVQIYIGRIQRCLEDLFWDLK